MNRIVLVVIGALSIAGCDNGGVGVSAGIEQGTGTKTTQTLQQSKELTQSKQDAVYIEKKLFPVIAQAARGITKANVGLGFSIEVLIELINHQASFHEDYTLSLALPDTLTLDNAVGFTREEYALIESLQGLDSLAEIELFTTALMINMATTPTGGWMSGFNATEANKEMLHYTTVGMISSEVMALVANELSRTPVSRQDLSGKALELMNKYSYTHADFFRVYFANRGFMRDLTGSNPAPVHFTTTDGLDVSVGSGGVQIAQYGDDWFGAGKMDGKLYTVRVSVSKGTGMTKGSSTETGISTDERQKAGASVNAG